jgi:hypothetical protein
MKGGCGQKEDLRTGVSSEGSISNHDDSMSPREYDAF